MSCRRNVHGGSAAAVLSAVSAWSCCGQPGTNSLRRMRCKATLFPPCSLLTVFGLQPGTFANTTGLTQCSQCDVGRYQRLTNQGSCDPCPLGQVCRYNQTFGGID